MVCDQGTKRVEHKSVISIMARLYRKIHKMDELDPFVRDSRCARQEIFFRLIEMLKMTLFGLNLC